MSTFAIGDIHGCFRTLQKLLERLAFDPTQDRILLVGDLVNRGPSSLEVLRWAKQLGTRINLVLGNHDLRLLGYAAGITLPKKDSPLKSVLNAPDCNHLINWLRHQPLVYQEGTFVLVHAGLLPQWTVHEALRFSQEIQDVLQGPLASQLLECLTWKSLPPWKSIPPELQRIVASTKILTQIRTMTRNGGMNFHYVGPLTQLPNSLIPWFSFPGRRKATSTILFGHWAALGLFQAPGILSLDTNCARGGELTAIRLEDGQLFHQKCQD